MIRKIILWYLKKFPLSEFEYTNMSVDVFDIEHTMTSKEQDFVFEQIQGIEGWKEYLTYLISCDIKRYFKAANPAEQLSIRGSIGRTIYIKSRSTKSTDKKSIKSTSNTDMPIGRYAE